MLEQQWIQWSWNDKEELQFNLQQRTQFGKITTLILLIHRGM
jgi:hypothetical protein